MYLYITYVQRWYFWFLIRLLKILKLIILFRNSGRKQCKDFAKIHLDQNKFKQFLFSLTLEERLKVFIYGSWSAFTNSRHLLAKLSMVSSFVNWIKNLILFEFPTAILINTNLPSKKKKINKLLLETGFLSYKLHMWQMRHRSLHRHLKLAYGSRDPLNASDSLSYHD